MRHEDEFEPRRSLFGVLIQATAPARRQSADHISASLAYAVVNLDG
jgi:hypothetical protein